MPSTAAAKPAKTSARIAFFSPPPRKEPAPIRPTQSLANVRIKSRHEAVLVLDGMTDLNTLLNNSIAARDAAIAEAGKPFAAHIEELTLSLNERRQRVTEWARDNRPKEFGDKQSLELCGWELAFNRGKRAVELLEGWTLKAVIARLQRGFQRLLRPKWEINKQQVLIDTVADGTRRPVLTQAKLATLGLKVAQDETFDISPIGSPAPQDPAAEE